MAFLVWLESIRNPVLDAVMSFFTLFGEELVFMLLALTVFWCVNKKEGYYLLFLGFFGTVLNQFLKILCRIPRPWVKNPQLTVVGDAKTTATGYSFPSGHTQNVTGTLGGIARWHQKTWLRVACVVTLLLTAFSRMYLGVHTPADVLVGAAMALVLIIVLQPVVYGENVKGMKILLASMIALSLVFLLYVELWQFPADMDEHNLQSGYKNAYTMLGCTIGAAIVYLADTKKLNFPVKAVWWAQIIKVIVGLALVLAVKEGLRAPLEWIFGGHMMARGVRYLLIVLVAGVLWPMTFSRFEKLGKNNN